MCMYVNMPIAEEKYIFDDLIIFFIKYNNNLIIFIQ